MNNVDFFHIFSTDCWVEFSNWINDGAVYRNGAL